MIRSIFIRRFANGSTVKIGLGCFSILRNELGSGHGTAGCIDQGLEHYFGLQSRENPLDFDDLDAFWKMLRVALAMDPANDDSCREGIH